MLTERLFLWAVRHPDPARRVIAVATLAPESDELVGLLTGDPAPEVRIAAAKRCGNLDVLATALRKEPDAAVRAALAVALGGLLCEPANGAAATAMLGAEHCTDAIRAEVARRAPDMERRCSAMDSIREGASTDRSWPQASGSRGRLPVRGNSFAGGTGLNGAGFTMSSSAAAKTGNHQAEHPREPFTGRPQLQVETAVRMCNMEIVEAPR